MLSYTTSLNKVQLQLQLHYTALHCTTLHCTTMHNAIYSTLEDTPPRYTPLLSNPLSYTTQCYTTLRCMLHYIAPHCTALRCIPLHYTTRHYINYSCNYNCVTLHYTTLDYRALHYTTLHYTTLITPPQIQLQMHQTSYTTPHDSSATLGLQQRYSCTAPHYIQQF